MSRSTSCTPCRRVEVARAMLPRVPLPPLLPLLPLL